MGWGDSRQQECRGCEMAGYDVFKKLSNGDRIWMCAVSRIQEAKTCLTAMQKDGAVRYFVCDLAQKKIIATARPEDLELQAGAEDFEFFG